MFIGRWEFWPDTFMCIALGVALTLWIWFVWWIPRREAERRRQRHLHEKSLKAVAFINERRKHRHFMRLLPPTKDGYIYWACDNHCPTRFETRVERGVFNIQTIGFPYPNYHYWEWEL